VLLGVGFVLLGVGRALEASRVENPAPRDLEVSLSPLRDVVREVDADATFGERVGQQHLVHLPSASLLVLNATDEGLQVVADQSNQGRTWRSPLTVPEVIADAFAADVDAAGRVHIGFVAGSDVSYARLELTGSGWTSTEPLVVDDNAASPVVDIAWDPARDLAHLVWAQTGAGGQRPAWAALTSSEEGGNVAFEEPLAEAGGDVPVLVNVATSGRAPVPRRAVGTVISGYRRGDSVVGWRSRALGAADEPLWGPEEQLPIEGQISAAALAVDPRGTGHLVLHDATSGRLAYLRRAGRTGWASPETAVEAPEEGTLSLPVISVDEASRMVYVFFERGGGSEPTRIALAVRDPATGWEGAYEIARRSDTPEGSIFPSSLERASGQAIVMWTSPGDPPKIQVARVTAP
jgi:hypothetical protein